MRIEGISVYPLRAHLPVPFRWATGLATERSVVLIKITTNDGLVGWGEALNIEAAPVLRDLFPLLVGQDLPGIALRLQAMRQRLPQFGKWRRLATGAIGALDMALWDIRGQADCLPVVQLLGGLQHSRAAVYASGIYYRDANGGTDAGAPTEAMSYVARGFNCIKMKIGGISPDAEKERIASVRDAVGPKITLMADANGAYDLNAASAMGRVLAEHGFHWFEEPLNSMDVNEHLALKEYCSVLLAAGERWECAEFEAFLRARAIGVAQPNVGNIGGFHEALRVLQLGVAAGIQIALHSWGTPLALAATVHLACSARGMSPPLVEFDCTPNPLRAIVKEPIPSPVQGFLAAPRGPGLGVSVDEKSLQSFCVH